MITLCTFNIHKYEYTPAKYISLNSEILGIPSKNAIRKCSKCGKIQEEHMHCLGLNPPEYVCTWITKD